MDRLFFYWETNDLDEFRAVAQISTFYKANNESGASESRSSMYVWVEFVGSVLCSKRFFPRVTVLRFSPLTKNQHLIWFAVI